MSLVGFKAQNHPQQRTSDEVDDRATTPEVFDPLDRRYGFTIDVAAGAHNTKCDRYYDRTADGLSQSWAGEVVWCNPPYSDIGPWIRKAWAEWHQPPKARPRAIVMLLPANRTEQDWWQTCVEPYRDSPRSHFRVEFLPGRIRFIKAGATEVGPNERPPFGCALLVWDRAALSAPMPPGGEA